jgi:hypothetical protein
MGSRTFGLFNIFVTSLFFALLRAVIYPWLLIICLYWIGKGLVASKRAVVTVLLVGCIIGEFVSSLLLVNGLPVPLSAMWGMPPVELASSLLPVLYSIVLVGPVTFFLALGALALPSWLKTMKK